MDLNKKKSECRHYDYCSAPLCPLEREGLFQRTWYIHEEICIVNEPPYWVERQEKLRKRTKNKTTCYTFAMIKHKCMIKFGINGIQPSMNTMSQQNKLDKEWIKNHKLKKPLSIAEREIRIKRLEKARLVRKNMSESRVEI